MALKFITADEAAALVQHGDNVGFSGFTPAGCPKVVPGAIAKRAEAEHAAGRPFKIGMFTGASTGDRLDGALARAEEIIEKCVHPDYKQLLRDYLELGVKGQTPQNLDACFAFHREIATSGDMRNVDWSKYKKD